MIVYVEVFVYLCKHVRVNIVFGSVWLFNSAAVYNQESEACKQMTRLKVEN